MKVRIVELLPLLLMTALLAAGGQAVESPDSSYTMTVTPAR